MAAHLPSWRKQGYSAACCQRSAQSTTNLIIPGIEDTEEAYDALNSALAVNFNTIHAVRKGKMAPLRSRPRLRHSLSAPVPGSQRRGRISLTQDPTGGLQYAGELIAALHRAGWRQRQGQDLDRSCAGGAGALSTFTASHAPFRRSSPSCSSARKTRASPFATKSCTCQHQGQTISYLTMLNSDQCP